MIHEKILDILSASNKAMSIAEMLPLLHLVSLDMQYSNIYTMKICLYQTLDYLVRQRLVIKLKDYSTKRHPNKYCITDSGLDYVCRYTNLDVAKRILQKIS